MRFALIVLKPNRSVDVRLSAPNGMKVNTADAADHNAKFQTFLAQPKNVGWTLVSVGIRGERHIGVFAHD